MLSFLIFLGEVTPVNVFRDFYLIVETSKLGSEFVVRICWEFNCGDQIPRD